MARTSNKLIGALAAALVIAALAPTASMAYVDLRSPDARDAGPASQARDYVDLRSPDARDAGRPSPDRSPSPDTTGGSSSVDWDGLGIAAGILALIAGGAVALFRRRTDSVATFRSRARHTA